MNEKNQSNLPQPHTEQPIESIVPPANPQSSVQSTAEQPTETTSQQEPFIPSQPPEKKREGGIISFVVTLVIAIALVQLINLFLFQSYKVFGSSMVPFLHDGDRLIISKVSRTVAKITGKKFQPTRGEVIVFVDPLNPEIQLIKRVIGLPGERVKVENGKITVYNTAEPQGFEPDSRLPYGKNLPITSGNVDLTVPENHLFVSGDNREGGNSLDSRNQLGTVPEDNIIGVLKVRFWPTQDATFF